jgi:D-methionine transport system ATP-binding protein
MNAPLSSFTQSGLQRLVPAAPIVRLEGVSKVFGGKRGAPVNALDGVDLTIQ